MRHHLTTSGSVVVLSRKTGGGKTKAIQASVLARNGISLIMTPTVTLTSFMASINQQAFHLVVNLDKVQPADHLYQKLSKYCSTLDTHGRRAQPVLLVASPHTLLTEIKPNISWTSYLRTLAKGKYLRLIVMDEAHAIEQHGRTYRTEYRELGHRLMKPLARREWRPNIMFVSATFREASIEYASKLWGLEVTHRFRATARELARRDIRIHVDIRNARELTSLWKQSLREYFKDSGNQAKAVVFTNFKARVDPATSHVYDATNDDIYVHPISGDSSRADKSGRIATFCELNNNPLGSKSRCAVITAPTGAEGYDSRYIRLVIREGVPSSIEQLTQEMGRIRNLAINDPLCKFSDYRLYISITDYESSRALCKNGTGRSRNFDWAIEQIHQVLQLCLGNHCFHRTIEEYLSDDLESADPTNCNACPACRGETRTLTVPVVRATLASLVYTILQQAPSGVLLDHLVDALHLDNDVCRSLFRRAKSAVKRYKVECLILKMIAFGLVDVFDREYSDSNGGVKFRSFAKIKLGFIDDNIPIVRLYDDSLWETFELLQPK